MRILTPPPRPRLSAGLSRVSRGITLVEMMLVLGVVGIIVVLVIARYTHASSVGGAGAAQAQAAAIAAAVDNYKSDKGVLPPSVPVNTSATVTPAIFGGAGNVYLNATPTDAGSTYLYGVGSGPIGFGSSTDFWVLGNRTYDGSALAHLKKADGTSPVAGTTYRVMYHSTYGALAY